MQSKIGFLINPIAGMGGKVGLKGTDGVLKNAIKLGATPIASKKASEMLKELISTYPIINQIQWFTCKGDMGSTALDDAGIKQFKIIYTHSSTKTTNEDTKKACKKFLDNNVDLILFCGGDGTARDIYEIVGKKIPLLGIPSGVKMHSAVFGITTGATAKILAEFVNKTLTIGDVEIMDLDEELYRKGTWNIRLFGIAQGIVEPTYVQVGKMSYESVSDDAIKDEIAEHIEDEMDKYPNVLFFMGSGGTIDYIARKMNIDNTLLGIDAVYQKNLVMKDINEKQIIELVNKYPEAKVILSPIGAQGFILGRGNLQLSTEVIRKIGVDNIIVVATPSKLVSTPFIRVDTGDKGLDRVFMAKEFMMVVIGYRFSRVIKIQTNNF